MATSSILENITIKNKKAAVSLADALVRAEKETVKVKYSTHPSHELKGKELDAFLGKVKA